MVHSPDFVPEHSQNFSLRVRLFVWRLLSSLLLHGTGICHHALAYIFCSSFVVVSVHSFPFFSSFLFRCCCLLILVSISYTEWSTIPACASLMYSFNRDTIEESKSWQKCVFDVLCMYTLLLLFYVCVGTGFVD